MEALFEKITNPAFVVTVFALLAFVITIYYVAASYIDQNDFESRMKNIADERERLRQRRSENLRGAPSIRNKDAGIYAKISQQYNLESLLKDEGLDLKLKRAGIRNGSASSYYYVARAAFMLGFTVFGFIFIFGFGMMAESSLVVRLFAIVAGFALGYFLPSLYLSSKASSRLKEMMKVFPDALDMLLLCAEAGMSVEVALNKVSAEIGTASPALADELAITVAELSYLPERRSAYENFAERTGHEGVKAVTVGLVQAELYGTPVGEVLRVMAKENRAMRMNAAKKKAHALPSQMTVPMIIFFLPVLFIIIGTPAYIQIKETWV